MVMLQTGGLGVNMEDGFEIEPWTTLLRRNMQGSGEDLVPPVFQQLEEGDCLAMEDRNNWDHEWPGRRVFVLLGLENVLVFDEQGCPVDEPDFYVPGGVQPLRGDNSFETDWQEGYYRIPLPCEQAPADATEEDGEETEADGTNGVQKRVVEGAAEPPAAEPTAEAWAEGRRCRLAFGAPPQWYGGLVGLASKDGDVRVAFDDGELKEFSVQLLKGFVENKVAELLPADHPPDGLVANVAGLASAAGFTFLRDEPVGVLVGARAWVGWGGEKLFQDHVVCAARFEKNDNRRVRRRSTAQPEQDRLGFHTTKAGEEMEYMCLGPDEDPFSAWNFGIVVKMKNDNSTGAKLLVMYDKQAGEFFLQACNHWARMPANAADNEDADSNNYVPRQMDAADRKCMEDAWEGSSKLGGIKSHNAAAAMSREPPPTLAATRRDAEKLRKAEEKEKKNQQLKLDKKAAKARLAAEEFEEAEQAAADQAERERKAALEQQAARERELAARESKLAARERESAREREAPGRERELDTVRAGEDLTGSGVERGANTRGGGWGRVAAGGGRG